MNLVTLSIKFHIGIFHISFAFVLCMFRGLQSFSSDRNYGLKRMGYTSSFSLKFSSVSPSGSFPSTGRAGSWPDWLPEPADTMDLHITPAHLCSGTKGKESFIHPALRSSAWVWPQLHHPSGSKKFSWCWKVYEEFMFRSRALRYELSLQLQPGCLYREVQLGHF